MPVVASPKGKKRGPKLGPYNKWKPITLVQVYRLARIGMSNTEIAKSLKLEKKTFQGWVARKPEVAEALAIARREKTEGETFRDWVYSRLSPELKALWDKIEKLGNSKDPTAVLRMESILQDNGKRARQELFLYALCSYGFSPSRALKAVNLSKNELDKWISEDYSFAELVQEIEWHKGNFFEEALVNLVFEGDTSAVLFANKTFNSSRGYGSKSKIEMDVVHSGAVMHGVLDLTEIAKYLSEGAQSELLEALRKMEAEERKGKREEEINPTRLLENKIADLPLP